MEEVKNYFVSTDCDDNTLVYVTNNLLSQREVEEWARKAIGDDFNEAYEIRDDEIQYYYISDRIWIDTQEKADNVRKYIAA